MIPNGLFFTYIHLAIISLLFIHFDLFTNSLFFIFLCLVFLTIYSLSFLTSFYYFILYNSRNSFCKTRSVLQPFLNGETNMSSIGKSKNSHFSNTRSDPIIILLTISRLFRIFNFGLKRRKSDKIPSVSNQKADNHVIDQITPFFKIPSSIHTIDIMMTSIDMKKYQCE